MQISRRERRPDRAVYIPRAVRRSQPTAATTAETSTTTMTTNIATTGSSSNLNSDSSSNYQNFNSIISITNANGAVSTTSSFRADDSIKKKLKAGKKSVNATASSSKTERTRTKASSHIANDQIKEFSTNINNCEQSSCDNINSLRDQIVYAEKHQHISHNSVNPYNCDIEQQELQLTSKAQSSSFQTLQTESRSAETNSTSEMNTTKKKRQQKSSTNSNLENISNNSNHVLPPNVPKISNILIEQIGTDKQHNNRHCVNPSKCDIEQQELQRASKEINRSNRRIIKQTFVSDVLEIPEKIEPVLEQSSLMEPIICENSTENEEDDWESKYNESGDCLDPKMLQDLETAVGKVKITEPKADYSAFFSNQSMLNNEEFPHVLEVSNFPVEFKNQDLLMVFSQYKESGFDIKWVDDTHALAVFSSSKVAAEVLTMGHPFVVLKPLTEATLESRLKAKKCSSSLQPYRQRPETCVTLARRLVTGALGMRLTTTAAERANEKEVLRRAKERKLLAAKQRDEAWES